jgi:hypothetical protein
MKEVCLMILFRIVTIMFACSLLTACQFVRHDELREVKIESDPQGFEAIKVTSSETSRTMTIRHMIANGNVFVECFVPNFEFEQEASAHNEGYLIVSVDHKPAYPVYKAAFVIKDLSKGSHHIRIQLADHEGRAIKDLEKQFLVTIE